MVLEIVVGIVLAVHIVLFIILIVGVMVITDYTLLLVPIIHLGVGAIVTIIIRRPLTAGYILTQLLRHLMKKEIFCGIIALN